MLSNASRLPLLVLMVVFAGLKAYSKRLHRHPKIVPQVASAGCAEVQKLRKIRLIIVLAIKNDLVR